MENFFGKKDVEKREKKVKKHPEKEKFSDFSTNFQQAAEIFLSTGIFPYDARLSKTFSTPRFSTFQGVIFEFSTGVEKIVENFWGEENFFTSE